MSIIVEDPAGTPWGCYSVQYYRLTCDGTAAREHGCDSDVSEGYVRRQAARLRPGQALVATCRSQTGGLRAYGSAAMQRAMSLHEGPLCSGDGADGGDSPCGAHHVRDGATLALDLASHECGECREYTPGAQTTEGLCPRCWRASHPGGPPPVGGEAAGWDEEEVR